MRTTGLGLYSAGINDLDGTYVWQDYERNIRWIAERMGVSDFEARYAKPVRALSVTQIASLNLDGCHAIADSIAASAA